MLVLKSGSDACDTIFYQIRPGFMVLPLTSPVAVVSSSVKWGQYQWPRVVGKMKCNGEGKGLSVVPDARTNSEWLQLPLLPSSLGM